MSSLAGPHERALILLFSELASAAARQTEVFLGSPGSLAERTNGTGTRYWVRRYSDAAGRRQEAYLGKSDDPAIAARITDLHARITDANSAIASVRLLARAGFATVDRKAFSTVASLHNHGLFRAGALLIGSHAYGALLNALGVRAAAYSTEDVDTARRAQLAVSGLPPFIDMLRETGLEFFPVPALHRSTPSTSFAERGGSRLRVDVSQLRSKVSAKPDKDLRQAATLIEALTERFPNAVAEAVGPLPKSAVRYAVRAVKALGRHLPASEERAWEELKALRAP